ncbi:MAG TPA: hypothetical protein VGA37_05945 [Gemmatimonadales bacterium]
MKLSCLALTLLVVPTLPAQQRPRVDFAVRAEWTQLPHRVDRLAIAHGNLGIAAEIGTKPPWAPPWLRLSVYAVLAPARVAAAAPGITTLGGGAEAELVSSSRFGMTAGVGFEALTFEAGAYNQATNACTPGYACGQLFLGYHSGWRLGTALRAHGVYWMHPRFGVSIAPTVRALVPYGEGGPQNNAVYGALAAGVTVR